MKIVPGNFVDDDVFGMVFREDYNGPILRLSLVVIKKILQVLGQEVNYNYDIEMTPGEIMFMLKTRYNCKPHFQEILDQLAEVAMYAADHNLNVGFIY